MPAPDLPMRERIAKTLCDELDSAWFWEEASERRRAGYLDVADAVLAVRETPSEASAQAWDEGALAAWGRSTPEVNGARYNWRRAGEPVNPYRAALADEKGS